MVKERGIPSGFILFKGITIYERWTLGLIIKYIIYYLYYFIGYTLFYFIFT